MGNQTSCGKMGLFLGNNNDNQNAIIFDILAFISEKGDPCGPCTRLFTTNINNAFPAQHHCRIELELRFYGL